MTQRRKVPGVPKLRKAKKRQSRKHENDVYFELDKPNEPDKLNERVKGALVFL
jgi:hypothetical protein